MKLRIVLIIFSLFYLGACTTVTEVVQAGKDTYIIAGDDSWREVSGSRIKTKLYERANTHCEGMGKKLLPLNESVSSYAAELRFRCLNENDLEYVRPIMESVPDVTIERT